MPPLFAANRELQVLVCDDYLMYRDGDNTEIFSLKAPEAERTRQLKRQERQQQQTQALTARSKGKERGIER
jgi:hypothetical protein